MSREGEWVIGIDLGTTNSCVGLWRNGRMEIIENDQGNKTTPSCVAFDDTEILVGEAAKNQAHMNPTNTIFAAKRLIGRRFSEESVRRDCKLWPFRVIPGPDDKPNIVVTYRKQEKRCPPEEISAVVLGKMRSSAEEFLGCKVTKAVITVPAYFNDSQRQATIDAAKIAGLHVLQIINEPTAAALAYSSGNWSVGVAKRTILIFDLGGGTLDVSLAEVRGGDGGVDVRATDGNTHLGGEDFDSRMVQHLIGLFRQKHGHDLMANPRAIRRLRTECESAKRNLSSTAQTDIFFPALYREIDFHVKMSRATFEEINRDLFAACLEPVKRCLAHARMEKSRVQDVVLVGGSTRIPMVRNLLKDYFQTDRLFMSISADEAVAHGAALLAAKLSSRPEQAIRRVDLGDVTPRSLGIDVRGGQMHVLINRNTSVPCRSSYLFTTPKDDMVSLRFKVCEGESKETRENNLLGEFYLHGLRKAPMGSVRIDVVFDIDKNGILTVSAKDLETQQVVQITIANTGRLEGETVEEMAREAESHRIEDRRRRKATAAKDELKRYLSWVENAVVEHRVWNLLDGASSRRSLESAMNNSRSWMESARSAEDFDFQDKMNDVRRVWEPIRRKLQELRVDVPEFRS